LIVLLFDCLVSIFFTTLEYQDVTFSLSVSHLRIFRVKVGSNKGKDATAKKKIQAEALVDRVFRKTGGGFGVYCF